MIKISGMTAASAFTGAELFEVVQGGASRKGTIDQILDYVSLGYVPEDVDNKSTNPALGTSDTLYPTQHAVKQYVDANAGGAAFKTMSLRFSQASAVADPTVDMILDEMDDGTAFYAVGLFRDSAGVYLLQCMNTNTGEGFLKNEKTFFGHQLIDSTGNVASYIPLYSAGVITAYMYVDRWITDTILAVRFVNTGNTPTDLFTLFGATCKIPLEFRVYP